MSARDCRRADLWMAAIEAGGLDEASRIRLLDHLESCPACAARARGIAALVRLLRADPVELPEERQQQVWARILAATSAPASQRRREPSRRRAWQLGLVAGLAAILLTAGLLWLQAAPPEPGPKSARPGPSARWRVVFLLEASILGREPRAGGASPGERLEVGPGGRAVLASSSEVLIVRAGSELRFARTPAGAPVLELLRGALAARTLARGGHPLLVRAGPLTVRPLGTAFSVSWRSGGALEAVVLDGRVEISRAGGPPVVVLAGQALRWGDPVRPLEARERRALEEDLREGGRAIALPDADSHPSGPLSRERVAPGPASHPRTEIELELRGIERLLARGHTARARARAERLLDGAQAQGRAPTLRTLVAESFLRERRYREARDRYLLVWSQFARSPLGADGLYMVGSLELEQLGEPARARGRFEHYLSRYPRGRQREGAYYLLCQALLKTGEPRLARASANRYLAEFPRGQLRSTLERIASPGPP